MSGRRYSKGTELVLTQVPEDSHIAIDPFLGQYSPNSFAAVAWQ